MAPLETHELASLASGSALPHDFDDDHDERGPNYSTRKDLDDDETSDHENENEGVGVALLGGRSLSNGTSGKDGVSRPKGASQVIKTIITEVRVCLGVALQYP
jgi:hypothetical protein